MTVSVLILTLNEEINLDACLDSLAWCDDIVVLDSFSTDRTIDIAKARGARVVQRVFDNWSAHQNWAVQNIEFKHPWVLYLDADERCAPDLRDEALRCARSDAPESAFRIRRKDFYMGRWLKHAQLYPSWFVRLFRPKKIRYERLVNPVAIVDGVTGTVDAHILHYPFSHGIAHWIARHNRYSDFEATEALKIQGGTAVSWAHLLGRDPNARRRTMKDIFFGFLRGRLSNLSITSFGGAGFSTVKRGSLTRRFKQFTNISSYANAANWSVATKICLSKAAM